MNTSPETTSDEPVYLVQRVWTEPAGYGRGEHRSELQPGRGYFTNPERGQSVIDELNSNYRTDFEEREGQRQAAARANGVEVDPIRFEDSAYLPRFVLVGIPPALTTQPQP